MTGTTKIRRVNARNAEIHQSPQLVCGENGLWRDQCLQNTATFNTEKSQSTNLKLAL